MREFLRLVLTLSVLGLVATAGCSAEGGVAASSAADALYYLPCSGGDSLVACYQFNGDLSDGSGRGNNASGGATFAASPLDQSLVANGTKIAVPEPDSASLDVTRVTLEAVIKLDHYPSVLGIILDKDGQYALGVDSDGWIVAPVYIGGVEQMLYGGVVPLGSWAYLASTFDGNTMSIYLNGDLVRSRSVTGNISTSNTNAMHIGSGSPNTTYPLSGEIETLRVSNRALSAAEIQANSTASPPWDCNANGVRDADDIAHFTSFDCNFDDRPDECDGSGVPTPPGIAGDATVQVFAKEVTWGPGGPDVRVWLDVSVDRGATFQPMFDGAAVTVGGAAAIALPGEAGTLVFRARINTTGGVLTTGNEAYTAMEGMVDLYGNPISLESVVALRNIQSAYGNQMELACFVRPFVEPAPPHVFHLAGGAMVVIFELGGSVLGPSRDFQDLVLYVRGGGGGGGSGAGSGGSGGAVLASTTATATRACTFEVTMNASGSQTISYRCPAPICVPSCAPDTCGSDGCGGTCACPDGAICSLRGYCKWPIVRDRYAAYY